MRQLHSLSKTLQIISNPKSVKGGETDRPVSRYEAALMLKTNGFDLDAQNEDIYIEDMT